MCNLDNGCISVCDPDSGIHIYYTAEWLARQPRQGSNSGGSSGAAQGFAGLSYFFGWG